MKDQYGGRRFLLSCACLLVATFLQWTGKLDPSGNSYMLIVVGVVGVYVGGNVAERHSENQFTYRQTSSTFVAKNDDAKDRT